MIFILATMVFFILRILPGDPVTSALGPKGTPEMIQHIRATLGLNDPLIVQYGRFLWNMVALRFGEFAGGGHRPIIDEMSERFPATLELIIPASILALLIGVYGGALAASKRKKTLDYSLRVYSVVIYSLPIFWFGLLCSSFSGSALDGCRSLGVSMHYWHPTQNGYQYLQSGCLALGELAGILFCSRAPRSADHYIRFDLIWRILAHDTHQCHRNDAGRLHRGGPGTRHSGEDIDLRSRP